MSVATFCKGAYGALTWIIILIATVLEYVPALPSQSVTSSGCIY